MHVIAVAQQKGGVGKSTLAIHLASEAQRDGLQSVIIELDRQGTASAWSAARKAAGLGKPDVMRQEATQLEQTLSVMRGLGVQLVVLDLPGSSNPAVNTAIKLSDLVLLPSRPQETDLTASAEPLNTAHRLGRPYAYVITFAEGKGERAEKASEALTSEGHAVVPEYVSRRQDYVDAVVAGKVAFEFKASSKAAEEIAAVWAWVKQRLVNGRSEEGSKRSA